MASASPCSLVAVVFGFWYLKHVFDRIDAGRH